MNQEDYEVALAKLDPIFKDLKQVKDNVNAKQIKLGQVKFILERAVSNLVALVNEWPGPRQTFPEK